MRGYRFSLAVFSVLLALVGCSAWLSGAGAARPASAATTTAPAYVTPLMAHTAWTATDGCKPVPGVITLPNVLSGHVQRGYRLTGTVVTGWIKATTRNCIENLAVKPFPKPILLPSWTDLQQLHTTYPRFDLASASVDYKDLTSLTTSQQISEACNSATAIISHGWQSPLPLFAYPNNKYTTSMNATILSSCPYKLGRRYSGQANTKSSVASGFLNVYSINGGHCTDASLPCSSLSTRYAYTPESTLAKLFHPAAGTWVVPQFYRLVTGSHASGRLQWNCTGAQGSHYTYDTGGDSTELYCANDYYTALANEPSYVVKNMTIREVEVKWGL